MVGEQIAFYRKKVGFTQKELAKRAGINKNYLSGIENGHFTPHLKTIAKIAKHLECEVIALCGVAPSRRFKPKLIVKGKPVERQGRKATGSKAPQL